MSTAEAVCCPRFDPEPWDGKTVTWQGKRFLKDRVRAFLHIPLNYGAVMTRMQAALKAAGADLPAPVMLTDENSPWGADVYVEAQKDVPGATMATLSGTFATRVFEGPFSQVGTWVKEMKAYLAQQGQPLGKLYFSYTTCPACAKKYGKNYVVLLAPVSEAVRTPSPPPGRVAEPPRA